MSKCVLTINNPGTMLRSFVEQNDKKTAEKFDYTLSVLSRISSVVKQVHAVTFRMVYYVIMDAMDALKAIPQGGFSVKKKFKDCQAAFDKAELNLLYCKENRFFHIDDMDEDTRAKYRADFTDYEYFELWKSVGDEGYKMYSQQLQVLRYKYEKVLRAHNAKYCKEKAKIYLMYTCIDIACQTYKSLLYHISQISGVEQSVLDKVFCGFNLAVVLDKANTAVLLLQDMCKDIEAPNEDEKRDIRMGKEQFEKSLLDGATGMDAVADAISDNRQAFASRQVYRALHRDCREMAQDMEEELSRIKAEKVPVPCNKT